MPDYKMCDNLHMPLDNIVQLTIKKAPKQCHTADTIKGYTIRFLIDYHNKI